MTQAPTPGPLSADDVKLLVKGDLLLLDGQPVRFINLFMGGIRADDGSGKRISALPPERFAFIGRPGPDDWMPWSGNENPVPGQMVEVKIRWRNGQPSEGEALSDNMSWYHRRVGNGEGGDIIAFRLAPTAPVEASGSERKRLALAIDPRVAGMDFCNYTPDSWMGQAFAAADRVLALRPQPSGETRPTESLDDAARRLFAEQYPDRDYNDLKDMVQIGWLRKAHDAILSARPSPVASGGQHSSGEGEAAGCAEPQVGRAVYERIEKLLKTDPTGWERAYLCHLVESVEEVGGYDGPRLDDFPYRKAVSAFLKLRDESVGPGEADDEERLESADIILSLTTPARAEALDEGVAGERGKSRGQVAYEGWAQGLPGCEWANQTRTQKRAWEASAKAVIDASPVPAQDDDKLRRAVEAYETMRSAWSFRQASALHSDRAQYHFACGAFDKALDASDEALAALKSTAAQEGGSK